MTPTMPQYCHVTVYCPTKWQQQRVPCHCRKYGQEVMRRVGMEDQAKMWGEGEEGQGDDDNLSSFPTVFIKDQGTKRQRLTTYSIVTSWHSQQWQLGRTVHTGCPGECPLTTAIGQGSVKPICCLVFIYFPSGGLSPSLLFGGAFFPWWFCQQRADMYLPLPFPLFTPHLLGVFFFNSGIVDRAWYL